MAAPALNLDLSAIVIGQPRVPDPIANALSTIQTTINSLGNVHIASDAAIAITKLASYTAETDYTPVVVQTGTVTKTVTYARYRKWGRKVDVWMVLGITGAGTGNSAVTITLPEAADKTEGVIGTVTIYNADAGPYIYGGAAYLTTANTFTLMWTGGNGSFAGISPNFALASGDVISAHLSFISAV